METKVIVNGFVHNTGESYFWYLNGDIEFDPNGREIYIESRRKIDSSETEDWSVAVSDLPIPLQEYIKTHKKTIPVPDGEENQAN